MSWDNDFPSRSRRRRRRFPFSDDWFSDMDSMFENMFRDMANTIPKELVKERRLPDGSTVKEMGPIVYGYSMSVGPDGKPIVREFGKEEEEDGNEQEKNDRYIFATCEIGQEVKRQK